MSVYLLLRTLKWLGMLAYGAGLLGALSNETPAGRSRAVQLWASLGFALLWFSGWGLARLRGLSLGSAYLSASMALSLLSMQLLLWSTERRSPELARAPGRVWAGRLAALLSVAIVVLMVTRPGARPISTAAPAARPVPDAAPSQP